ncbi:25344_t:CDS:2, partial [Gigaspora margarita]
MYYSLIRAAGSGGRIGYVLSYAENLLLFDFLQDLERHTLTVKFEEYFSTLVVTFERHSLRHINF